MENNDQTQNTTFDESTLSEEAREYFATKTKGLEANRNQVLNDHKTLAGEIKALGGLETLRALREQADKAAKDAEELRMQTALKDGNLTEIQEKFRKEIEAKDTELSTFKNGLLNKHVESELKTAIVEEGGNPKLLTQFMRSRIEASFDENGEPMLVVKGENGETVDAKGKTLTLKSLIAEFKADADFGVAFKADATASGAGNRNNKSPAAAKNPFASATRDIDAQMKMIIDQPELARQYAKDAGTRVTW